MGHLRLLPGGGRSGCNLRLLLLDHHCPRCWSSTAGRHLQPQHLSGTGAVGRHLQYHQHPSGPLDAAGRHLQYQRRQCLPRWPRLLSSRLPPRLRPGNPHARHPGQRHPTSWGGRSPLHPQHRLICGRCSLVNEPVPLNRRCPGHLRQLPRRSICQQ